MQDISLTAIEFKLLIYLARHPNKVFTRDDILDTVWGKSLHVYPRSVDTHISKLRKKLESQANLIESVHGSGYRFKIPSTAQKQNNIAARMGEQSSATEQLPSMSL